MTKMQVITEAFWFGWKAGIRAAKLISKKPNIELIHSGTLEQIAAEGLKDAMDKLIREEIVE